MSSYRLSRAATDDLVAIFLDGLEAFGIAQADRYHYGLEATFAFLAAYPRAARERTELVPPVRVHRYRSHMIVYDIAAGDGIRILRVRHGREDWLPLQDGE